MPRLSSQSPLLFVKGDYTNLGPVGQRWCHCTVLLVIIVARSLSVKLLSPVERSVSFHQGLITEHWEEGGFPHHLNASHSHTVNPYCKDLGDTFQGHNRARGSYLQAWRIMVAQHGGV